MRKGNTGLIVGGIILCILVILGSVLGVYFGKVTCPSFGYKCPTSTPGGGGGGNTPAGGGGGGNTPAGGGGGGTPSGTPGRTPGACTPVGSTATDIIGGTDCCSYSASFFPLDANNKCLAAAPGSTPGSTPGPTPSSTPVNCVGAWGACSVSCGDGTQTYAVTTPAANGGTACPVANGATRPCTGPPCGVNCVGSFSNWGACSATCGYGTQTRTYTVTTQGAAGGTACPHPNGYQEEQTCPNLPACATPVACSGHWTEWTGCSVGCGGGTQTREYVVDTAASGGGAACPYTNGQTQSQACNTMSCCSAATVGGWYDVGGVICTGSSDPDPYIYQSRAITFPQNPSGASTAQACGITVAQTRKTAGPDPSGNKCPPRNPVIGTCSLGNSWSALSGCALPAASATPNCPSGYMYNSASGKCEKSCGQTQVWSYSNCPTTC